MRAKQASRVHAVTFKGGGENIKYYYLLLPIIAKEGPVSETWDTLFCTGISDSLGRRHL